MVTCFSSGLNDNQLFTSVVKVSRQISLMTAELIIYRYIADVSL